MKALTKNTFTKYIFLIGLILFSIVLSSANFCLADETLEIQLGNDYLITSDKTIKTTFVSDERILTLEPFFTIFNEKNVWLIHPQKVGKTNLTLFLDKSDVTFNVTVRPHSQTINNKIIHKNIFEIMPLDIPPSVEDELKLDEPPKAIKKIDNLEVKQ